jgi:hypothetical protein
MWLDSKEVIGDGNLLPEGHPRKPQPRFDVFID